MITKVGQAEYDRRKFAKLARQGFIPAASVAACVDLAACARRVRAHTGSDATVLEALIEICTRSSVEDWLRGRYR